MGGVKSETDMGGDRVESMECTVDFTIPEKSMVAVNGSRRAFFIAGFHFPAYILRNSLLAFYRFYKADSVGSV